MKFTETTIMYYNDPIVEIADFKIRYGANLNSYTLLKNS